MRTAISFLTPFGGARSPGARTMAWFPVVGAAIGFVLGGVWWGTARIWPASVAAALVVVADLAVTGMLHFDGLVDSADGLLPHLSPGRRLEVMADPQVGAFGVAAGAAALLLRWSALSAIRPRPSAIFLLAGLWCLSRTGMAAIASTFAYMRGPSGLAAAFEGDRRRWTLAAGAAASAILACSWKLGPGAAAACAAVVAGGAVALFARRRIGGYTGDVLGAAGIVAETTGLLVAAVRW